MRTGIVLGGFFAVSAAMAWAQDSIVGSYKGSFPVQTNIGDVDIGVTLVISSLEDGRIKGTGTYHRGTCAGDYPFEGGIKGDAIGLRGTRKGGPAGDCSFGFKGRVDGNRLVGHIGRYAVELRK